MSSFWGYDLGVNIVRNVCSIKAESPLNIYQLCAAVSNVNL